MLTDLQMQLLTHYALGELPPARLPEIERLIADEAEARAWVAEVRGTAAALSAGLAGETAAATGLDPARKAAIAARAGAGSAQPLRFPRWLMLGGSLAAAGLVVALILPGLMVARSQARHVVATAPEAPEPVSAPVAITIPQPAPAPKDGPIATRPVIEVDVLPQEAIAKGTPSGREEAIADSGLGGQDAFRAFGRASGSWSGPARPAARPAPGDPAAGRPPVAGVAIWDPESPLPQPPVAGMPATAPDDGNAVVVESAFQDPRQHPLSTFGLDVDTASYANLRHFIEQGRLPPPAAVRIEEMLNAFSYADPPPQAGSGQPLAVRVELAACPWAPAHRLARIAVSAMAVERGQRPPCNLVFLIDVSGSMGDAKKLPLVQNALAMLTTQLRADDRVAIVTYSDTAKLVLPSTPGSSRATITAVVRSLTAGGSTNGAAGIQLAYQTAQANAVAGVNRVILCTDGDFNLGAQTPRELQALIEEKRTSGITLTALGFGMGDYKDATLQVLADKGNGTYAYIDSEDEARKALVEQLDSHLVMVAKDAKVQVEFNPARVASWRLIGYEKRQLSDRAFADDRVDSGDIGAGAHVTALYELETRPEPIAAGVDPLRYQHPAIAVEERWDAEVMFVKLRWKRPDLERSELIRFPVADRQDSYQTASADFRFAAAVAAFGMVLRDSPERGDASLALVEALAGAALGDDRDGRRAEFLRLVSRATELAPGR